MMLAWVRKNVESWANEIESAIVEAQIGSILMKDLNSSTCVIVHNFHLLLVIISWSVTTAALSKNLQ